MVGVAVEPLLIYDQPHIKIYVHEDLEAVHLMWQGFALSAEFREAIEFSLEELISRGYHRMIADNRMAKAIDPLDQKWLYEEWFPKAIASGLRNSAVLTSTSNLNKYASDSISNAVNGDSFQACNFTDFDDACAWLKSCR